MDLSRTKNRTFFLHKPGNNHLATDNIRNSALEKSMLIYAPGSFLYIQAAD